MTEPTLDVAALQADAEAQAETQRAKLSLEDVVALGDAADGLQAELDELASQARVKQEALNKLLQVDLPNALTDLGLTGIDLKSGARVEVVEYISAGIKEENREAAHSWMRDNNFGDLIKNDVTVSFGKGEDEFAKKTAEMLLEMRGRGEMKFGVRELHIPFGSKVEKVG